SPADIDQLGKKTLEGGEPHMETACPDDFFEALVDSKPSDKCVAPAKTLEAALRSNLDDRHTIDFS
ncbi:hypothetical protein ACLOJK_027505, partial [Asimina triloba]